MFTLILTVALTQAAPAAPKTADNCSWPHVCKSAPVVQVQTCQWPRQCVEPAVALQVCSWPHVCGRQS